FSTDSDYMPFVHTLENNTVKGEMLVSPFGGYTCNTEFEFLTGLTMGLLPAGSTPYLQYISTPFENAIPRHLSKLGYKSVALHPYYARCWNRELVYGCLGFDEFISLEKFDDLVPESDWEYVRYYMSDRTDYEAIKKCLEEKDKDKPLFLFNVTMQNHGGYTYDGPEFPTVTITDMQGTYPETEQYLSLIKESDDAFRELVDYLKGRKEKTIVVMFGDHQPAVEQQFFEELYGKPLLQLETEELQRRYKVPFVIWANYDIKEQKDVLTSTNYLSNLVLDAAGIPKTCIGNFTEELRDEVPRINGMGYYDNEGNWHDNEPKKPGKLRDYDYIEYYSLTNK
ncbi:MAG: LTA synthase family protein, partial [Clostridia bacterium]|nr:LTA synthase family protein [Clostridia bacterium]